MNSFVTSSTVACFYSAIFLVVTVAALLLGQVWIDAMPKGPQQKALNMWLIPAIALGGFGLISCFASLCYYTMPMPTARLKLKRITETHVWLTGAAPRAVQFFKLGRTGCHATRP